MLLPQEFAKLNKSEQRVALHRSIVIVLTFIATVLPAVLYLPTDGHLDHLLGRSEPVVAAVESVHEIGSCSRSHRTRYRAELSWTVDGVPGNGVLERCAGSVPRAGSVLDVWVGPNDTVVVNSPTVDRVGLTATSLVMGCGTAISGLAVLHAQRQRRRQLLAVGNLGLSQPTPVQLHRGYRGRLHIVSTAPVPVPAAHGKKLALIFYSRYGSEPSIRLPRQAVGPWWLRFAPTNDPRRQIVLLERGQERCWAQLSGRHFGGTRFQQRAQLLSGRVDTEGFRQDLMRPSTGQRVCDEVLNHDLVGSALRRHLLQCCADLCRAACDESRPSTVHNSGGFVHLGRAHFRRRLLGARHHDRPGLAAGSGQARIEAFRGVCDM